MRRKRLIQYAPWGVGCAFLLLFLVVPAWAQSSFRLDLKTADAVYEVIEKSYHVHRDGSYTLTLHVKMKILTYKGKKDHADFRYSYNAAYQSVKILKAYTLKTHGQIIPVRSREIHDINDPQDTRATIYSRQRMKVVNFPSVEPGTTVEIRLKLQSKRGFWATECFRLSDPILLKVVTVSLPARMPFRVKLPTLGIAEKKEQKGGRMVCRWMARDIPKQVMEPMLPPMENRGTCLFLSTFPAWKDVAAYFSRMLPKVTLRKGLEAFHGSSSDDLYVDFMKHFIIYPLNFFHTSLSFQPPDTTLKKGYGSQADLAILFYALLRGKGYAPEFLMMNSEDVMLGELRDLPIPSLFDDVIVRCEGRDYAFYAKDLPPGFTGLQGQQILDLKTGNLVPANQLYYNCSIIHFSLVPTTSFTLEGAFTMRSEGRQAVSVREWLRYKTRNEWRIAASQILHDIDPLARPAGEIERQGLDTLTVPVVLKGRFVIPRPFPVNGDLSFITLEKPDLPGNLETLLESRRGPLMVPRDYTERFDEEIVLPPGVYARHYPPLQKRSLKVMDWMFHVMLQKNKLKIQRVIHLKRGILFPGTKGYFKFIQAIRSLYSPVNRLIVLEKILKQ